MEKRGVAPFGLWVCGEEPRLVRAVPALGRQAIQGADWVSTVLAGAGTGTDDSRAEEFERDN